MCFVVPIQYKMTIGGLDETARIRLSISDAFFKTVHCVVRQTLLMRTDVNTPGVTFSFFGVFFYFTICLLCFEKKRSKY